MKKSKAFYKYVNLTLSYSSCPGKKPVSVPLLPWKKPGKEKISGYKNGYS